MESTETEGNVQEWGLEFSSPNRPGLGHISANPPPPPPRHDVCRVWTTCRFLSLLFILYREYSVNIAWLVYRTDRLQGVWFRDVHTKFKRTWSKTYLKAGRCWWRLKVYLESYQQKQFPESIRDKHLSLLCRMVSFIMHNHKFPSSIYAV